MPHKRRSRRGGRSRSGRLGRIPSSRGGPSLPAFPARRAVRGKKRRRSRRTSGYDSSYDVPSSSYGPAGPSTNEFQSARQDGIFALGPEMLDYMNFVFGDDRSAFGGDAYPGALAYSDAWFGSEFSAGGGGGGGGGGNGGGGGGPPAPPPEATFSVADINIEGAPDWWQAMIPDITNPQSSYQTMANLMIPMLSPEDQRTVASNLFQSAPDQFGAYNPEGLDLPPIAGEITQDLKSQFLSGQRAQTTLDAFDRLLEVSGKTAKDFGPGYSFLRGLADTFADFDLTSGATQYTETQQNQLLAALDPQLAQTKNPSLAAFGPLAQSFTSPFFSGGSLTGSGSRTPRKRKRNLKYY